MKVHTTVIGSYPPAGKTIADSRKLAIDDQLKSGIDFISDGQVRVGFRELFLNDLEGIEKIDDSLTATGKLVRERSVAVTDLEASIQYVGDSSYFKGILTGPLTLAYRLTISSSAPYESGVGYPDQTLLEDLTQAQKWVIDEYGKLDLPYIQIDEPTLGMVGPWEPAILQLEALFSFIKTSSILHVCGKLTPGLFEKILRIDGLDLLALEFAGTPVNLDLLKTEAFRKSDKLLSFGCVNSTSSEIEGLAEIVSLVKKAPLDKIKLINPDCGLRNLKRQTAFRKLQNLSRAAQTLKGAE